MIKEIKVNGEVIMDFTANTKYNFNTHAVKNGIVRSAIVMMDVDDISVIGDILENIHDSVSANAIKNTENYDRTYEVLFIDENTIFHYTFDILTDSHIVTNKQYSTDDENVTSSYSKNFIEEFITNIDFPICLHNLFDNIHHSTVKDYMARLDWIHSQVIIPTFNTVCISNDYMRPDCYYITDGSKLISFDNATSKELRESHNLEKMYRANAFHISEI